MAKLMTPSPMTDGQIQQTVERYQTMLSRHRREFPSDLMQRVLGQKDLTQELMDVFRRRVGLERGYLIFSVRVEYDPLTEVFSIPNYRHDIDAHVAAMMPKGESGRKTLHLFRPPLEEYRDDLTCDTAVEGVYSRLGLRPANPFEQAALHKSRPALARDFPTITHWRDSRGYWCHSEFSYSDIIEEYTIYMKRPVDIVFGDEGNPEPYRRYGRHYKRSMWFVGVPQ